MKLNSKQQIRLDIISKYLNGEIQRNDACSVLEISIRQFSRIVKAFRQEGITSLIHGNTAREPVNKTCSNLMGRIELLYKGRYHGLNLRHFIERLQSDHFKQLPDIPCYSTIRKHLIKNHLHIPHQAKTRRSHRMRKPYDKEGIMVQIDGSHHRWITGSPMLCLTAAIDDATGKILGAKFTKTETTFAAMDVVEQIINKYGVFQMLYSDKAGIYGGGKRDGYSNMNKALDQLGIVSLQANSPQAKGKVERLFHTLQSRLVNDMRLDGVRTMEEANKYLERYIDKYNTRFSKQAYSDELAYKPMDKSMNLNEIFVMRQDRQIQSGQIVNYNSQKFLVDHHEYLNLIKRRIEIRHYRNGEMKMFLLNGEELTFKELSPQKLAA